jgi:hypothetical protein
MKRLRIARVSAVEVRDDEILVPCFPLLRNGTAPQGARVEFISKKAEEHSMMTIAFDLLNQGMKLDEIRTCLSIPDKWTEQQIGEYISENGKMKFREK